MHYVLNYMVKRCLAALVRYLLKTSVGLTLASLGSVKTLYLFFH